MGEAGIEESEKLKVKKLDIYPNPFLQFTKVLGENQEAIIDIYDMAGKLVVQNSGNIIGKDIARGIYFVRVGNYKPIIINR